MRHVATRGRLIVVGGHSRGVGKTAVIEHLLRANRAGRWTAIKISAHRHAPAGVDLPLIEECRQRCEATQTGRYLSAGASRAFLVRAPDASLGRVATFINGLREGGRTVVVESNRIVQWLIPDVLLFVVDPTIEDWKPSSACCLPIADAVIHRSQAATLRLDDSPQFSSRRAAFDRPPHSTRTLSAWTPSARRVKPPDTAASSPKASLDQHARAQVARVIRSPPFRGCDDRR